MTTKTVFSFFDLLVFQLVDDCDAADQQSRSRDYVEYPPDVAVAKMNWKNRIVENRSQQENESGKNREVHDAEPSQRNCCDDPQERVITIGTIC